MKKLYIIVITTPVMTNSKMNTLFIPHGEHIYKKKYKNIA